MYISFFCLISLSYGLDVEKNSLKNTLNNLKWKNRVLLLLVEDENNPLVNKVHKFFSEEKCNNEHRNLKLFKIIKNKNKTHMPSFLKNKSGIFLIGYDGHIKAEAADEKLLKKLHYLIDKMPIRKKEKTKLYDNCK